MTGPLHEARIRTSPLILDGAMGTELQRRGVNTGLPLWSANALLTHRDMVETIHADYIDAGAHIITANTFRTTRRTMKRANLPDRSEQLTRIAVEAALRARDHQSSEVLVAGSIAPVEDCYRPDLVPEDSLLNDEHGELAARLALFGVDFILVETMNTIREATIACKAARATGKEVVVSFVCNPKGEVYGGESLMEALHAVLPLQPAGISVNCVSPRFLESALATVTERIRHANADVLIGAYGNVGIPESEKKGWEFTREISEEAYADAALRWEKAGASIIGGCCGTTPSYIRSLAARWKE